MNWIELDSQTARDQGWLSWSAQSVGFVAWRYDFVNDDCKISVFTTTDSSSTRPEDYRGLIEMTFVVKRTKTSSFPLFKLGYEYAMKYRPTHLMKVRPELQAQLVEAQIQGILHYMSQPLP